MRSKFLLIFILWFVLISFLLVVMFRGSEGGITTLLLATFIFALPASIVATLVHKWTIEARLKTLSNTQVQESISVEGNPISMDELSANASRTFAKLVGIIIIATLSVFIFFPLPFLFFFYYTIKKLVDVLKKKSFFPHFPWFVGVMIHGALLYFVLHYVYQALYRISVLTQGTSSWIFSEVSGLVFVITLDAFIAFFGPVLCYEWYRIRERMDLSMKIPTFWFVLVPNLISLLLFWFFSLSANGEALGFGILNLIYSTPLSFIIPSVWILWQERKRGKSKSENQGEMFSATSTIIPDKQQKFKAFHHPLLIVIVFAAIALGGFHLYQYISLKQAISEADQMDKQQEQEMAQDAKKEALEDSTPAPPNPIFDGVVAKVKSELAIYLGVPESKITTLSYNVKWTGVEWVERAFCVERSMKYSSQKSFLREQVTMTGDVKIVNDGTVILSTKPEQTASVSIPIELQDPLLNRNFFYYSFDYRLEGPGEGNIRVLLDDKEIASPKPLQKNGKNGYAKDTPLALPAGDVQLKHRLSFTLKEYGANKEGSVGISRLYIGTANSMYPCVTTGSENRRVIFQEGTSQYTYVINASGKYFRAGDFR